ncbi:hypothetical protein JMUB6875_00150 [Nocardia sp. JMUB6875]
MAGRVLATVKAEAMAGPSTVSSSSCLPKPVTRLSRVAMAIDPESRTSLAFELSGFSTTSAVAAGRRGMTCRWVPLGGPGRGFDIGGVG